MKTVKDFKDAGLVFVDGDVNSNKASFSKDGAETCNNGIANDHIKMSEFAWRTNTGVKPDFNGEVEFLTCVGMGTGYVNEMHWLIMADGYGVNSESITRWRPLITKEQPIKIDNNPAKGVVFAGESAQPSSLGDEEGMEECLSDIAKLFGMVYGIDCGWSNLADNIEAKLTSATTNQHKPVYTQAMANAGELPPVGSKYLDEDNQICVALCHTSTFVIGQLVEHLPVTQYPVISTSRNDRCKPIDTRTDEEKLRDALAKNVSEWNDERAPVDDVVDSLLKNFTITLNEGE